MRAFWTKWGGVRIASRSPRKRGQNCTPVHTHPDAGVSATTSGLIVTASSTIGGGTNAGLTVNGIATTSGLVLSNIAGSGNRFLFANNLGTVSSVGLPLSYANGGGGTISNSTGNLAYYGSSNLQNVATGTISAGTGISLSATAYAILNALQIAVDQAANFAWTGVHDFGAAVIEITNGSNPTVDAIGETALDTTANELLIATSTSGGAPGVLKVWQPIRFSYASSTQGSGTTTRSLGPAPAAGYLNEIQCDFSNFMRVMVYDGTNRLNDLVASSTIGTVKFTTNQTFTAGEAMRVDIGTTTNIAANVYGGCTAKYYYTRN